MIRDSQATATMRGVASRSTPNWWIRFATKGWEISPETPEQRERIRRGKLSAWLILGLLVVTLVLLPSGLAAPATLTALVVVVVGLVIALLLNRSGLITPAGTLLSLLISGAILYAVISTGDLSLVYLPAYDLLVISVVVAASVLSGWAAFWMAALNIGIIIGAFTLQGHSPDVTQAVEKYGVVSLIVRPIALQVAVATVAFLWMRGTTEAISRADKAEELAQLEHAFAEQRRQLEIGVQQILETHVRVANGDYGARAAMNQGNALWQIAASLNNLLGRLQKSGQAEHQLRRTEEEIRRLAAAIDDAQAGRRPIWPAQTGTAADILIDRMTGRSRQQPMQPMQPMPGQMPPLMPPGQMAQQIPGQMPGMLGQPEQPNSGALGSNTGQLGPGWVNSGPLSNPRRNEQMPGQGQGAPENPWFLPPENQGW